MPVHPRLRGEHPPRSRQHHHQLGSSPPARGTLHLHGRHGRGRRFIPACAGNTPGAYFTHRVHNGSSPPARGTRLRPIWRRRQSRFIPACAGNTAPGLPIHPGPPVHPRLRGEHLRNPGHLPPWAGSSPPARGTRLFIGIPLPTPNGSSPPARGTRNPLDCGGRVIRFIPACAGNTLSVTASLSASGKRLRIYQHLPTLRCQISSVSGGMNATRKSPSNSTGTRRLSPIV